MQRLVLVGGGHAHLSALRAIAQKRSPRMDVTLITPSTHQNYSGMLPGWIAGHYNAAECRVDLRPLVHAAGAHLILAQMVGMDATRRCVALSDGQHIAYDLLSLNVGSETDTSWLETLGPKLLPVKPLDNFFTTWPRILAQAKASKHYRLAVVGAGAAGVEIALAAQHAFARAGINARVDLVASDSGLLAGHARQVRIRVHRFAKRAGLSLHFLRGVGTEGGVLLSDGRLLEADHVIAATGARPPVWLERSKLARDAGGYILVDRHHRSVSHLDVVAVGDVCARRDTAMPHFLYFLACGPRHAVASWGRWSAEGEWVWRWKDWIDRRFIRRFSEAATRQEAHLLEETQ